MKGNEKDTAAGRHMGRERWTERQVRKVDIKTEPRGEGAGETCGTSYT